MLLLVSNPEIKMKLKKRNNELIGQNNGYLICDKCGGYYKLQANESQEDFDDNCECGGFLHIDYLDYDEDSNNSDTKLKWDKLWEVRKQELQEEKLEKSRSHKTQGIRNPGNLPWGIIGAIIIGITLFSFLGIFGLLFGILFYFLFRGY